MNGTGHESGAGDHAHHGSKAPAGRVRVPRRLVYVPVLVAAVVSLFFLVPDGGSSALLVLFAGLMALHHLPGSHHGGHATARATARGESAPGPASEDPERTVSIAPLHH